MCELCGENLESAHRHVVDLRVGRLRCACGACAASLQPRSSGAGHYRLIPTSEAVRHIDVPPVLGVDFWQALGLPTGVAFVILSSSRDRPVAFRPDRSGVSETAVSLECWDDLLSRVPALRAVEPDVEGVLFRLVDDDIDCYVVPVDQCYQLASRVRRRWRGPDGGPGVAEAIAHFWSTLEQQIADGRRRP